MKDPDNHQENDVEEESRALVPEEEPTTLTTTDQGTTTPTDTTSLPEDLVPARDVVSLPEDNDKGSVPILRSTANVSGEAKNDSHSVSTSSEPTAEGIDAVSRITNGPVPAVVVSTAPDENGEDQEDNLGEEVEGGDDQDVKHPLIPLKENKIAGNMVQEVTPKYPVITNKLTGSQDDSVLHASQKSLPAGGKDQCQRSATMNSLDHGGSFHSLLFASRESLGKVLHKAMLHSRDDITFGSMASLQRAALKRQEAEEENQAAKEKGGPQGEEDKPILVVTSGKYMKNLLAMCFTITLVFIALGSVRNLQSSINHEGGIGVICLAVSFIGYTIGGLLSPIIVQNIAPRKCLIAGIIPHIIYTASNLYPAAWLMAPSAFVQGVSLAVIWNAMSTYITLLAKGRSDQTNVEYNTMSGRYFGIFGLFYQSYFIIGNLIAAIILQFAATSEEHETDVDDSAHHGSNNSSEGIMPPGIMPHGASGKAPPDLLVNLSNYIGNAVTENSIHTQKDSDISGPDHIHICGAKYWQHYDLGGGEFSVTEETKFLLFGVYIAITVAAMLIAMFILEDLNPRLFESTETMGKKLKTQLWSLLLFFKDVRFLLIFPMLLYSYTQVGFVSAEVTKAFITCPLGIYMVGYTMVCLGICASASSYLSGLLTQCFGRIPQFILATTLNMVVLVYLLLWQPNTDSLVPYFVFMGIWGAADGIWVSQINSCLGVIFTTKFEEAFAGLRVAQGIGVAVIFGLTNTLRMDSKLYFIMICGLVGIVCYLIMEVYIRRQAKKSTGSLVAQTSSI